MSMKWVGGLNHNVQSIPMSKTDRYLRSQLGLRGQISVWGCIRMTSHNRRCQNTTYIYIYKVDLKLEYELCVGSQSYK